MVIKKYTEEYSSLVTAFNSGNFIIDNFLKSKDSLDPNQGITYLMLSNNKDIIIGYFNISTNRVDLIEEIGDKTVYYPMNGSININYLALDKKFQKTKIGESKGKSIYLGDMLLRNCEEMILTLREYIGFGFITLSSTKEGYNLYHNRNDYIEFEDDMNIIVKESDKLCYKLYKCIDDII